MSKCILITGGAGFIGSHLIDNLIKKGHNIVVFDNLEEQVHGKIDKPPEYLNKNIKFVRGSVLDYSLFSSTIKEAEVIFHLAAAVGVGQSMYQVSKYVEINTLGTANLLDILINEEHDVNKLIIASSMSIYGEGKYECELCGYVHPKRRKLSDMEKGIWEHQCENCGKELRSVPTDEEKPLDSTSIYAMSKKHQEKMSLLIGETYGIDTTALRLFNVYGSRQSLSNPYTGVCAIFCSNLLCGNPPLIFEDGLQTRDFVNVKDVCQALVLSMENRAASGNVFNVGTGIPISIKKIAETLIQKIKPDLKPIITNKYRKGDIRHCYADISKIKNMLGFQPKITFENGIEELIQWIKSQVGKVEDKSKDALEELKSKGLT
jgi:dTDP-L-rhamnose 4-epimerase